MEKIKTKNIVIVGAGITGLSLLHFLVKKYKGCDDVEIRLFERDARPGGTINTLKKNGALFETGPNGFLGPCEQTFELIKDLNLEGAIVQAGEGSQLRFIAKKGQLHPLPLNFGGFVQSKLLSPLGKARALCEPLVKRKNFEAESIFELVKRRFGREAAEFLIDPFVSGVYAGDARLTVTKTAFPKLDEWEQQYGSILKALRIAKRERRAKPKLNSFQEGMGQLINALYDAYSSRVFLKNPILKIFHRDDRYVVSTQKENYKADELYVCTPAYVTAEILNWLDKEISSDLKFINYAPVVVIGILLPKNIFVHEPKGFGYLNPSSENKEVLGGLFESNIFPGRTGQDDILFRFMVGGARHLNIYQKTRKELMDLAYEELENIFPTKGETSLTKINPRNLVKHVWFHVVEKAIPQYDQLNMEMNKQIDSKLKRFRDLYLLGNYRGGVSFNDCIANACCAAQKSSV